jgi:hypothetical protein
MVETKICVLPKEAMDDLILERPWENAIGDHKCVQKYLPPLASHRPDRRNWVKT